MENKALEAASAAVSGGSHRTLELRCRCVGTCAILGVDDWGDAHKRPDDEPWNWTFEFFTRSGGGTGTLRHRIKNAFAILLGRDHFIDCVCLDGTDVQRLLDFLHESLPPRIDR